MKTNRMIALLALLCCLTAAPALAEDFLGLPILQGGQVVSSTPGDSMVLTYKQTPEELKKYYEGVIKDEKDTRVRVRGDQIRVEDFGARPWHTAVITKNEKGETVVTLKADSWSWITGMLTLRFTGVFMVLLTLFIAMSVATGIIQRSEKKAA